MDAFRKKLSACRWANFRFKLRQANFRSQRQRRAKHVAEKGTRQPCESHSGRPKVFCETQPRRAKHVPRRARHVAEEATRQPCGSHSGRPNVFCEMQPRRARHIAEKATREPCGSHSDRPNDFCETPRGTAWPRPRALSNLENALLRDRRGVLRHRP